MILNTIMFPTLDFVTKFFGVSQSFLYLIVIETHKARFLSKFKENQVEHEVYKDIYLVLD